MLWEDNQYLVHYGVPGQQWRIRRYQNKDGSLTPEGKIHYGVGEGGNSKLNDKYEKEMNKLRKFLKRSDVQFQRDAAAKYNKRAGVSTAIGSAATGYAVARVLGVKQSNKAIADQIRALRKSAEKDVQSNLDWYNKKIQNLQEDIKSDVKAVNSWQTKANPEYEKQMKALLERDRTEVKNVERMAAKTTQQIKDQAKAQEIALSTGLKDSHDLAKDTKMKVAASIATGAYGLAAYNKVRAVTAKHWTNEKTHEKAVQKAQAQYDKMKKTFANTPYMSLFKEQIAAYKKEHPNTQLTDRQIAQNLMA